MIVSISCAGFCIFMMVVDHMGGSSWLYAITGGNTFFVSAAEGFVFISGFVLGQVHRQRVQKEGFVPAVKRVLQRAWTLYQVTIGLTFAFAALSVLTGMPWAEQPLGDPVQAVIGVLTLHRTYNLADVALMYTLLMLITPLAMLLLEMNRVDLLLLFSFGLWGLWQLFPNQAQFPWAVENNSVFNLAAWQVLFFAGLALGFYRERVTQQVRRIPAGIYAPVLLAGSACFIWLHQTDGAFLTRLWSGSDGPTLLASLFAKTSLPPLRLLACFFVFSTAYLLVTVLWKPLARAFAWLLMPLGKNSLSAYALHPFLVLGWGVLIGLIPSLDTDSKVVNTTAQIVGILILWALMRYQIVAQVTRSRWRLVPLAVSFACAVVVFGLYFDAGSTVHASTAQVLERVQITPRPQATTLSRSALAAKPEATTLSRSSLAVKPVATTLSRSALAAKPQATTLSRSSLAPVQQTGQVTQTLATATPIPLVAVSASQPTAVGSPVGVQATQMPPARDIKPVADTDNRENVAQEKPALPAVNPTPAAVPSNQAATSDVGGQASANSGQAAPQQAEAAPTDRGVMALDHQPTGVLQPGTLLKINLNSPTLAALNRSEIPMVVYLPPGYATSQQSYPVVYMLHGISGEMEEWLGYGIADDADRLIAAGKIQPMILVFPWGAQEYWVDHADGGLQWGKYVTTDVRNYVEHNFRTLNQPQSRAISGLSMGAHGALQLSMTYPGIYGVVASHSLTRRAFGDAPSYFGDQAYFNAHDPLALAQTSDALSKMKIWLDVGDDDPNQPTTDALHKILTDRGIAHQYTILHGAHGPDYWTQNGPTYLEWYSSVLVGQ